ncbi:MAG TPA: hypothetical protein VJV79_22945 [Polyangiaceae bacterium]|nr:hypothetical protein [Polyangiaceae bacterium]
MSARNTIQGRANRWLMLAVGVLLVGLGAIGGRAIGSPTPASSAGRDTAPQVVRDSSAIDQQRLAALEQQVLMLRADGIRQQVPAVGASEPSARQATEEDEAPAPKPADREEAARLAELARLKFLDGLAHQVDTEARDPAWRNQTEPVIAQLLPERLGTGVTVDKISCATSLCRARVSHPGSTHLPSEKVTAFLDKRGPLSSLELQFDTREDGVTTLYFLRPQEPRQEH